MNVLGIDLSLNATGLAMISIDESFPPLLEFGKKFTVHHFGNGDAYQGCLAVPAKDSGTLERWESMLSPIMAYAQHAHQVQIEGYSFASNMQYARALTEFGGIVRYHLRKIGHVPIEVAPTSLKKFVTGSGRAEKADMLYAVAVNFGVQLTDHNMADAFGLAKIGVALQLSDRQILDFPANQREVIQAIKHPPIKVKKTASPKLKLA